MHLYNHFSDSYKTSPDKTKTCISEKNKKTMLTCLKRWERVGQTNNMSRLMTKPTKWHVHPLKTQITLGIRPVWSESLLSAWRKLGSLATNWVHSKDSDQTGWMPRLIWVFAGRTVILLLLSWGGSYSYICSIITLTRAPGIWRHSSFKSSSVAALGWQSYTWVCTGY